MHITKLCSDIQRNAELSIIKITEEHPSKQNTHKKRKNEKTIKKPNFKPRFQPIEHLPLHQPILLFTRTEEDLISIITPHRRTSSNLTLQEKSALSNLHNNQSIIIKPCDKGAGICIMNIRDYLTKIYTHL